MGQGDGEQQEWRKDKQWQGKRGERESGAARRAVVSPRACEPCAECARKQCQ